MLFSMTTLQSVELVPNPVELVEKNPALAYLLRLGNGDSRSTQRWALAMVARFFGGELCSFEWAALRYAHIEALRSWLQVRYSPAMGNRTLNAVKGVMKSARRLGLLPLEEYERIREVECVRGHRAPPGRSLSTTELAQLFDAAKATRYRRVAARDAAIIALLYGAGLRRCDLCNAQLDGLRAEPPELRVVGKGNKERVVPLPVGTLQAVTDWVRVRGSQAGPLILPSAGDELVMRRMNRDTLNALLRRLTSRAGVEACTPHDLRRSYIGDLLDAGVDLATVQKLAGHADPGTTSRYDRRGERAKARAARVLHVPYLDPAA
jgi:site-specific recombinase XerD